MEEKKDQFLELSQIEATLHSIRPEPEEKYRTRMASAPWRHSAGKQVSRLMLKQQIAFVTLAACLLLVVAMMFTPVGKVVAQGIQQFFIRITGNTVPLPTEMIVDPMPSPTPEPTYLPSLLPAGQVVAAAPTATPIPTHLPNSNCGAKDYACQMDEAATVAGFMPWQFPTAPAGLSFDHMTYQPGTTGIQYGRGIEQITIMQSIQNFTVREDAQEENIWVSVPAEAIQTVTVGGQPAEYVKGQFMAYVGEAVARWDADAPVERLRWQNGAWWFQIVRISGSALGAQSMADLAAQLTDDAARVQVDRQFNTAAETTEIDIYTDVSELEAVAGFDILEPGLLPEGLPFSHARFISESDRVMLFYGKFASDKIHIDGPVMVIGEGPLHEGGITASDAYPAEALQAVEVNGYQGMFITGMMEIGSSQPDQPMPTPVWNPDSVALTLWWTTDKMTYSIQFNAPSNGQGMQLTQQTLLQVANSLR